jgi:hypothetical protein
MAQRGKSKTKTSASKARKRQATKDLSPRESKRVKGGATDFSFTPKVNKASPTLF